VLFNIIIINGIKPVLSKFVDDTKLCGVIYTPKKLMPFSKTQTVDPGESYQVQQSPVHGFAPGLR